MHTHHSPSANGKLCDTSDTVAVPLVYGNNLALHATPFELSGSNDSVPLLANPIPLFASSQENISVESDSGFVLSYAGALSKSQKNTPRKKSPDAGVVGWGGGGHGLPRLSSPLAGQATVKASQRPAGRHACAPPLSKRKGRTEGAGPTSRVLSAR